MVRLPEVVTGPYRRLVRPARYLDYRKAVMVSQAVAVGTLWFGLRLFRTSVWAGLLALLLAGFFGVNALRLRRRHLRGFRTWHAYLLRPTLTRDVAWRQVLQDLLHKMPLLGYPVGFLVYEQNLYLAVPFGPEEMDDLRRLHPDLAAAFALEPDETATERLRRSSWTIFLLGLSEDAARPSGVDLAFPKTVFFWNTPFGAGVSLPGHRTLTDLHFLLHNVRIHVEVQFTHDAPAPGFGGEEAFLEHIPWTAFLAPPLKFPETRPIAIAEPLDGLELPVIRHHGTDLGYPFPLQLLALMQRGDQAHVLHAYLLAAALREGSRAGLWMLDFAGMASLADYPALRTHQTRVVINPPEGDEVFSDSLDLFAPPPPPSPQHRESLARDLGTLWGMIGAALYWYGRTSSPPDLAPTVLMWLFFHAMSLRYRALLTGQTGDVQTTPSPWPLLLDLLREVESLPSVDASLLRPHITDTLIDLAQHWRSLVPREAVSPRENDRAPESIPSLARHPLLRPFYEGLTQVLPRNWQEVLYRLAEAKDRVAVQSTLDRWINILTRETEAWWPIRYGPPAYEQRYLHLVVYPVPKKSEGSEHDRSLWDLLYLLTTGGFFLSALYRQERSPSRPLLLCIAGVSQLPRAHQGALFAWLLFLHHQGLLKRGIYLVLMDRVIPDVWAEDAYREHLLRLFPHVLLLHNDRLTPATRRFLADLQATPLVPFLQLLRGDEGFYLIGQQVARVSLNEDVFRVQETDRTTRAEMLRSIFHPLWPFPQEPLAA